jgi:type III pantothenate kinase
MISAISIGNSRITAALIDGHDVSGKRSVAVRDEGDWSLFIDDILARAGQSPLVAASVNPPVLRAFEARCPAPLVLLGRDAPIPMPNRTLHPETTGHDRLLTGFAAARFHGPPLLVVDFGTAYTFNMIDEGGAFMGGAILPGLRLAAEILASGCSLLPEMTLDLEPPPLIGSDTDSAIRSGLLNGYLGLVESLVRRYVEDQEGPCPVIATGGDASFFVSNTSSFTMHDPDLVLKGIALAFSHSTNG